jgi:hypothetical protein
MKLNIKMEVSGPDWSMLCRLVVILAFVLHGHYETLLFVIEEWIKSKK